MKATPMKIIYQGIQEIAEGIYMPFLQLGNIQNNNDLNNNNNDEIIND
jgi:hypothetical protein